MKTITVYSLMVPLSEYASVPVSATLADAVAALARAQKGFDQSRYRHRAVLVVDEKNDVIGKISQMHVLKSLEPKYSDELGIEGDLGIQRLSNYILKTMVDKYDLFKAPFDEACKHAADLPIRQIMHHSKADEFINTGDTIGDAIHHLVMGGHQSLLVRQGEKVVGILRLTDVFSAAAELIAPAVW